MTDTGQAPTPGPEPADYRDHYEQLTGTSLRQCPLCDRAQMVRLQTFLAPASSPHSVRPDSS